MDNFNNIRDNFSSITRDKLSRNKFHFLKNDSIIYVGLNDIRSFLDSDKDILIIDRTDNINIHGDKISNISKDSMVSNFNLYDSDLNPIANLKLDTLNIANPVIIEPREIINYGKITSGVVVNANKGVNELYSYNERAFIGNENGSLYEITGNSSLSDINLIGVFLDGLSINYMSPVLLNDNLSYTLIFGHKDSNPTNNKFAIMMSNLIVEINPNDIDGSNIIYDINVLSDSSNLISHEYYYYTDKGVYKRIIDEVNNNILLDYTLIVGDNTPSKNKILDRVSHQNGASRSPYIVDVDNSDISTIYNYDISSVVGVTSVNNRIVEFDVSLVGEIAYNFFYYITVEDGGYGVYVYNTLTDIHTQYDFIIVEGLVPDSVRIDDHNYLISGCGDNSFVVVSKDGKLRHYVMGLKGVGYIDINVEDVVSINYTNNTPSSSVLSIISENGIMVLGERSTDLYEQWYDDYIIPNDMGELSESSTSYIKHVEKFGDTIIRNIEDDNYKYIYYSLNNGSSYKKPIILSKNVKCINSIVYGEDIIYMSHYEDDIIEFTQMELKTRIIKSVLNISYNDINAFELIDNNYLTIFNDRIIFNTLYSLDYQYLYTINLGFDEGKLILDTYGLARFTNTNTITNFGKLYKCGESEIFITNIEIDGLVDYTHYIQDIDSLGIIGINDVSTDIRKVFMYNSEIMFITNMGLYTYNSIGSNILVKTGDYYDAVTDGLNKIYLCGKNIITIGEFNSYSDKTIPTRAQIDHNTIFDFIIYDFEKYSFELYLRDTPTLTSLKHINKSLLIYTSNDIRYNHMKIMMSNSNPINVPSDNNIYNYLYGIGTDGNLYQNGFNNSNYTSDPKSIIKSVSSKESYYNCLVEEGLGTIILNHMVSATSTKDMMNITNITANDTFIGEKILDVFETNGDVYCITLGDGNNIFYFYEIRKHTSVGTTSIIPIRRNTLLFGDYNISETLSFDTELEAFRQFGVASKDSTVYIPGNVSGNVSIIIMKYDDGLHYYEKIVCSTFVPDIHLNYAHVVKDNLNRIFLVTGRSIYYLDESNNKKIIKVGNILDESYFNKYDFSGEGMIPYGDPIVTYDGDKTFLKIKVKFHVDLNYSMIKIELNITDRDQLNGYPIPLVEEE